MTGPNPTDRGKPGSKHQVVCDANGIPLAARVTGANISDRTQLITMIDAIPPVRGKRGAPRCRPDSVQTDGGYYSQWNCVAMWVRGVEPNIPRPREPREKGVGATRWVIERTIAWLHNNRRLRVRFDRYPEIHQAFLTLGCIMICHRILEANALC